MSGTTIMAFSKSDYELEARPRLVQWLVDKLAQGRGEIEDALAMKESAERAGLNPKRFNAAVVAAGHRRTWYEKLLAAVQAGYVMLPDLQMNVFAVRVDRAKQVPDQPRTESHTAREVWRPTLPTLIGDVGEGAYVAPAAKREVVGEWEVQQTVNGHASTLKKFLIHNADYRNAVLPVEMHQPALVEATARAMGALIFDEIGVCVPTTRVTRADPMILGRVLQGPMSRGRARKAICFNLGWFVNLEDLT